MRAGVLDRTFRGAHSLKGAARAVNVTDIEALCQSLEGVFAALKRNEIVASPELFDLLHRIVDALAQLLEFIDADAPASAKPRVTDLVHSLQSALTGKSSSKTREPAETTAEVSVPSAPESMRSGLEEKRSVIDTVRVSTCQA